MKTKNLSLFNLNRRGSGANLNLFRSVAMVLVLLTLGIGNVWGHGGACTAKLEVKKGTGSGSVYAATTSSAASGNSSVSADCGNSDGGTHTHTFYAFATPAAGYTFLGWTESATSTAGADASNPKAVTITSNSHSTVTKTLYAHFVEKAKVNITFEAPSNGTYTIAVNGGSTETVSSANVVKNNVESVTLTATPASGYAFAGWYKLNSAGEFVEDLSITSPYNASFTASETIKMGARFVPTTLGKFILKGSDTQYYGLKAATIAAGGSGTIVPVADETVVDGSDLMPFDNGSYILKAKLLIPYESGNTWQILPKVVTTAATLSAYKKLILMDGVNIVVNSGAQICIGGQAMAGSGSASDGATGYTTGACGVLDMSRGGHLELNNESTLYCWGFVKGQDMDQGNNTVGVGTITVNSGAAVWENFSVGDWRGGSATASIVSTRFFPFQSYFMQNIEVPTTFWHGSSEWCYFTLNATGGPYDTQFAVIGSSNCLFKLTDAQSKVRTWYDPTTDLMCYELSGSAILDELKIKITGLPLIGTLDINSSQFDLPITSNMHLILADCTMNLTKPLIIQPGSVVEIKNNATVTLTNSIYLYDKDDWGPWVNGKYFKSRGNLTTHKNRGNGTSNEFLDDAKFIIDGSFTIGSSGKLYSTAGGANIMGNGGGTLAYPSSLSGSSTLKWYKSTTTSGDGETGTVAVNNANPCNEDESYTKAIASTTFYNVHGRWFKSGNQNEKANHTYDFTYISSGAVSGTGGTSSTTDALYAPDKTGLVAGMKWCNVVQDGTCSNIYNATQALNETPASDIRYTYPSSSWLQLLKTETEGVYGGSDNSLYAVEGCAVNSLGSVDENCLYTIGGVKKALVDGHFVALEKNTEDEAWHDVANPTNYYISFAGCTWHPATKYAGEEKAYIVEEGDYIWYNNDWLLVEREEPFFFDYNDQNVKRYYEYENDEWVLADPKVRVMDAIETRDFFFLPEAFAIANGKKNATITLLKDITNTTTPLSYTQTNTTCTLDLNGHTVNLTITGSGTTGVNMIKIDASGSTFTITDNSAEKDGKLILKQGITTATATKRWYGIVLANGSLALNAGEVQAINDFTYTSTKNTGMISAIYIAAGKTFTMNGGSIYAESPYYPRAIEIAGSASANATVTLNTGTITANATTVTNAMGIYTVGGTTTIKEGVTINATTKTTSAYGIYVDASTSGYWGTVNMNGGTVNATATTTTALGAFVNGTYTFNNTTPNTIKGTYRAVLSISGGSFNVETLGTTTAYGIQTRGTTTITGGTFNVTPKTTTAYGLLVQDGTTTISGTPTFTIKGTTTAYGIYANGATPEDKTGRPYNPNVIVNGGTFDVTTTTGDVAYGVYAGAGTRVITSTASDYYPGIYSSIGTVTVNGGTFNVTAKTYSAIGVYVHRVAAYESGTNTAHVFRGVANIAGGTFTVRDLTHKTTTGACDGVRSYGTLNITGGSFDVAASAATAKNATYVYGVNVYDGTATVSGTPEFTVSAYGTAFGAVANGATPDKATGLPCEADLTIDGGTFNVNTTKSTTAYGVYAAGPAPRVITSTAAGYYPGTYYSKPVATVNDGTFNVKAKTTTAIGAYCGRGVLYDQEVLEPHTVELENFGELNIKGGTFNVSTLGTTTADGVRSFGTTNITGGTFNVTPKTTTATAIRTYAGKTTITGNPHFTVKGTTTVYGLNAGCEAPNAKSGLTYNGEIECNGGTFDLETTTGATCYGVYAYAGSVKITTLHSANADYFAGNYASAGTIVVNDGIFNVKAKTTGAYGVVVPAAVSQSGATGYPTATATAKCDINGGKFLVNGTEKYAVNKKATTANFKISGGYWGGDGVNNNLAYYAVSPNKVLTLREAHALYPDGYRYTIGEGGTVIWKNGETTLLSEDYLKGETPAYTGEIPTKDATAEYTYEHNGWDPAIAAMANADQTYTATFNHVEKKYTVNVVAGANGSVSPASVSGIGCVTASSDITATPNTGYHFTNWTLLTGVTAAAGYSATSNPIHIHATASGKTITANFAAKTYTVTLDNQSATTAGAASVTATYNETMPSIAANLPARTGYVFGGYFTETNGGGTQYYNADGTSAHIWDVDAASPTLYAKWTLNKYSFTIGVTPTSYGNVDVASITQIPHGSAVTVTGNKFTVNGTTVTATPTATTAEYTYAFSKWNNVPNTVTANVTNITAVFTRTARSYTLSWVTDGDVLTGGYTSGTVAYGTAITAPNTPTKTGYVFAGWHNGTSVVTPATTMPAANTTYTAQWTAVTYSVRFNKNDEDATGTMSNESFTYDVAKALTSNAFTKTGYNFAGWATSAGGNVVYTDGQSVSNLSATQGAVVDMYAKWTVATYEVALDANGGTGGSTSVTMTYNSVDHTAITNPTRTGYTFHSWNTTASSSTRKQVISSKGVMSENVSGYTGVGGVWIRTTMPTTLYARWSQKSYTTTFTHNGNGSISYNGAVVDAGGTAKVYHVSAKSLVATPNTGYRFTGWTVSGTNASKVTIADLSAASTTIKATAASATVTAGFAPDEYTISYKDQGDAEFSGVYGSGYPTTHTYGTATVLVSPTKEGYTFDGWYDNAECAGTALTEIGATDYTADFTLYAKWTAAIADRELDIVDWTSSSITINVTNLKAVGGTNKNNWKIYVNGKDYTRTSPECSTQSRTLTIPGLTLTPNENLLIQLKNDAGVIESQHNYKIPQIYNAENATLSETTSTSVVYVYGGKLTISGNTELAALYVCPGAEVEVTGTLTVGKLVLRTKPWATAAISGNVTATNVFYTRIAPDGTSEYPTGQYYQFGLPYECDIDDVLLSDGTTPAYNTTWILKSYNEQRRAESGTESNNWDVLASSGTIAAGRGYEMFSSYKYYREYYFPVIPTDNTSVAVTRHGDDKNNSGWNIVCSPLMSIYHNESDPVDGLKVSWLLADGSYDQAWPETIWPALPFSYQASANGDLDFSTNKLNQTVSSAPRRAAYKENIQTEWIHLDVKDGNGVGDHTSVFVHPDRFEATYETGIDVAKQSLTASRAIIYSSHAYGEMAFAGVADSLLEKGVALTVYSPSAQALTFSMRGNDWLNRMKYVWLVDHETGARTDLLWDTYTFEATEGTVRGRFTIEGVFRTPQITTDVESMSDERFELEGARKVLLDQKMFIQVGERLYDATGKLVKRK